MNSGWLTVGWWIALLPQDTLDANTAAMPIRNYRTLIACMNGIPAWRLVIISAFCHRADERALLFGSPYYPSTSATATSLTLVPVGPVTIRPPTFSRA